MTEYAFNAFILIITQMSSFFVNYEFESRMSFDHVQFDENTIKNRVNKFRERKIVYIMKNIWKFAKKHMKKSQQNQIIYVDRHRISTSNDQIENRVWLSTRNIQIDRSFRKLDHKMLESFKILKKRDSSYKFELSVEMNIHSVFHISSLRIKKEFREFSFETNHWISFIYHYWQCTEVRYREHRRFSFNKHSL
jgi:hypothetical protein